MRPRSTATGAAPSPARIERGEGAAPPLFPTYAFTMIELLVAATITVILAGLMLTVVVNALNSWNRSHGVLQAEAQARNVLDQLSSDLQGAMFRNDGNVWLAVTVEDNTTTSGDLWRDASYHPKPSSLNLGAGLLTDARFGIAGVWLRLVTARPTVTQSNTEPTAPVAIAYQLIRRVPPGGDPTDSSLSHYLLYRSEVAPSATFNAGYNLAATPAKPATAPYVTTLNRPDKLSFIADNVVDFGLRLYVRENGALRLVFPAKPSAVGAAPLAGALSDGTSAAELEHLAYAAAAVPAHYYRHSFPDVADVMIRVLTAEGVRQIQALETGQIASDWWTIALANSKVFTRRIELHPSPL